MSIIGSVRYSSGYPWIVYGLSDHRQSIYICYTPTSDIGGGIAVAIHGRPGICQSNSGVRGYSDIGGGIAGAIHGECNPRTAWYLSE